MKKENIYLHEIRPENEDSVLDILTSDIVKQTYMLPDYEYREAALPQFHRLMELSKDNKRYVRGIYLDTKLIGFLNDVENKNQIIELGYAVHPDFHGQGYMTAALKLAIDELFKIGYRQIITGAFEQNRASIRVMEKAGMSRLDKIDLIEYRGRTHECVYYHTVK